MRRLLIVILYIVVIVTFGNVLLNVASESVTKIHSRLDDNCYQMRMSCN